MTKTRENKKKMNLPIYKNLRRLFYDEDYCLNYLKENHFLRAFDIKDCVMCLKPNAMKNYD
jgi:hypothetical protein